MLKIKVIEIQLSVVGVTGFEPATCCILAIWVRTAALATELHSLYVIF